jgi:hypothetical protein
MSPSPSGQAVKRLLLVTGVGRSGTSTVAGTLHHLGLHVPLLVLKPNQSNPQGFFEPTWPVRFHNRLMQRALIAQTDARPEAYGLVAETVTEEEHVGLRTWMSGLFDEGPQVLSDTDSPSWGPRRPLAPQLVLGVLGPRGNLSGSRTLTNMRVMVRHAAGSTGRSQLGRLGGDPRALALSLPIVRRAPKSRPGGNQGDGIGRQLHPAGPTDRRRV